jgi:hypothetical protein
MFLVIAILRRLVIIAVVLAIPLIVGEIVARKLIGAAVRSALAQRIGDSPKVSLGSTPVLLQLVHGHLNDVTVTAPAARIGGLPPVAVVAVLRDVHLRSVASLQGAIGSVEVTARLDGTGVRALLASRGCVRALPSAVAAVLTATPRVLIFPGRIDLLPPSGRGAEVRLRPTALGNTIAFGVIAAFVDGRPLPSAGLARSPSQTTCVRTLGALPFGAVLRSATAEAGALGLQLSARRVSFSAI